MKKFTLSILLMMLSVALSFNAHSHESEEDKTGRVGFSACHSSYKKSIQVLHRDLAQRIGELNDPMEGIRRYNLNWVRRNFIEPQGREPSTRFQYANQASTYVQLHSKLTTALRKMKTKMDTGFNYYCRTERDKRCSAGDVVIAYVLNLGRYTFNRIYLCPEFWKNNHEDQLRTLMHELSHLAADTDHYFGSIFTDQGMINQSTDAYFFEKLMFDDLKSVLERNSWGFLWMRPRENLVSN